MARPPCALSARRGAPGVRGPLVLALAAAAFGAMGGCAEVERQLEPPPVNPSSPIAAYAERISRTPMTIPSLRDVPPKVVDAPPAATFKNAVVTQIGQRRDLEVWWMRHPPMTENTEGFAQQERGRIPKEQAAPVPTTHDAESEAFAKRLRDVATHPQ